MAVIEIETLKIRAGRIPPRALALVLEWAAGRRDELLENWALASARKPLKRIAPLE
jgi:hypothetical protein